MPSSFWQTRRQRLPANEAPTMAESQGHEQDQVSEALVTEAHTTETSTTETSTTRGSASDTFASEAPIAMESAQNGPMKDQEDVGRAIEASTMSTDPSPAASQKGESIDLKSSDAPSTPGSSTHSGRKNTDGAHESSVKYSSQNCRSNPGQALSKDIRARICKNELFPAASSKEPKAYQPCDCAKCKHRNRSVFIACLVELDPAKKMKDRNLKERLKAAISQQFGKVENVIEKPTNRKNKRTFMVR